MSHCLRMLKHEACFISFGSLCVSHSGGASWEKRPYSQSWCLIAGNCSAMKDFSEKSIREETISTPTAAKNAKNGSNWSKKRNIFSPAKSNISYYAFITSPPTSKNIPHVNEMRLLSSQGAAEKENNNGKWSEMKRRYLLTFTGRVKSCIKKSYHEYNRCH